MRTRESGRASIWLAVVAALCVAALGGGYYAGRYLLGEEYLKKQASEVRKPQALSVAPRAQAPVATAETRPTVTITPVALPRRLLRPPSTPAAENPEASTTSQPPPAEEVTIQLGSFADKSNADLLAQDLKRHGVASSTQATQEGARDLFKVRTGTYKSREQADAAAEELRRQGYNAVIVPKG